jgi:hypothetical protein
MDEQVVAMQETPLERILANQATRLKFALEQQAGLVKALRRENEFLKAHPFRNFWTWLGQRSGKLEA